MQVPGLIPDRILRNFQVTYSFCAHSLELGSTQTLREMSTKKYLGHKVQPARTSDSSAVLKCVECPSKDGNPTFHPPLNLHDLLRESCIVPLTVPTTLHSTLVSAWLGLAIGSMTGLRRARITHRAKQIQYLEPQEHHIFLTSIST